MPGHGGSASAWKARHPKSRVRHARNKGDALTRQFKRTPMIQTVGGKNGTFPPVLVDYIKYQEIMACVLAGASQPAYACYNLNSIFDEQRLASNFNTVTNSQNNGQGLYRDQLAGLYTNYRVLGADFYVRFSNGGAENVMVVAYPSMVQAGSEDISVASERSHAKSLFLTPLTGSRQTGSIKFKIPKLEKVAGVSRQTYLSADSYQAQTTTSPTNVVCMNIVAAGLSTGTPATLSLMMQVKIVLRVEWTGLVVLTGS